MWKANGEFLLKTSAVFKCQTSHRASLQLSYRDFVLLFLIPVEVLSRVGSCYELPISRPSLTTLFLRCFMFSQEKAVPSRPTQLVIKQHDAWQMSASLCSTFERPSRSMVGGDMDEWDFMSVLAYSSNLLLTIFYLKTSFQSPWPLFCKGQVTLLQNDTQTVRSREPPTCSVQPNGAYQGLGVWHRYVSPLKSSFKSPPPQMAQWRQRLQVPFARNPTQADEGLAEQARGRCRWRGHRAIVMFLVSFLDAWLYCSVVGIHISDFKKVTHYWSRPMVPWIVWILSRDPIKSSSSSDGEIARNRKAKAQYYIYLYEAFQRII